MSSIRNSSQWKPTTRELYDPGAVMKRRHAAHKAELDHGAPEMNVGPPPVIDDAEARRQDEADRLRRRKGRAAAILTGRDAGAPMTASKTLLGA